MATPLQVIRDHIGSSRHHECEGRHTSCELFIRHEQAPQCRKVPLYISSKTIATSMPGLGAVLTFTLIALISATELKYSNPGSTIGGQLDVVWKRDKQCNA